MNESKPYTALQLLVQDNEKRGSCGQDVTPANTTVTTARKPHRDFTGYVAERRNPYSGGHTIILDCKLAEEQGATLVEDYKTEGGRYQVLCNEHAQLVHTPNLPEARRCMKDPGMFCLACRRIEEGDQP